MMYLCVINNRRMNLTAEERYQWFCEKWPEVETSASNKQIASFLRMRPESLSRLKAQMKQSEKEAKTLENILVTKDLQWDYMDIKEMIDVYKRQAQPLVNWMKKHYSILRPEASIRRQPRIL